MAKKFKKLLLLGVMLIMALGLFACGKNAGIQFTIGDVGDFSTEALYEHPTITKLVKSVDELQQLCDESGVIYTGEKYDESYFNEKAIIVYSFAIPSTMMSVQIDSLKVDSKTLIINTTRFVPKSGIWIDVEAYRFYVLEVNQGDIAQIEKVQISQKDKNK